MQISVIIPMYNESKIIADTAMKLSNYMSANFESYEIIFSDDGSVDGCADILRGLALPCVRVVGYEVNRGKGSAIRHAMLEAGGDVVMFTDADLAYGVDVIRKMYDFYCEHSKDKEIHMMIGSRNIEKDGYSEYTLTRKLMSKMYIRILCLIGGFDLTDSQCGCKAFRRDAAREIFSSASVDGFAFDFEAILLAQKLNYNIVEIPVRITNHHASKVRVVRDSINMLKELRGIKKRIKRT